MLTVLVVYTTHCSLVNNITLPLFAINSAVWELSQLIKDKFHQWCWSIYVTWGANVWISHSFLILAERIWENKATSRHENNWFSPCFPSRSRQILWGCPLPVFPYTLLSWAVVSSSPWWWGAWFLLRDTHQHLYFTL